MNRTAVLGGAFDPPHNAHVGMAENAMAEFGYDRIVILPSANPPHKRLVGEDKHRWNMVKRAFIGDKYLLCPLEMENEGFGYTIDMIPKLREYLGEEFDYIIGGDSIRDFHKWYRYRDILREVKLIIAVRDGDYDVVNKSIATYSECPNKGIEIMQYRPTNISSTSIRLSRQLGYEINSLVPPSVYEYIMTNNLYSDYDAIRESLKNSISPERYAHSLRTAEFAIGIQGRLGMDYNRTLTAALLHDCAKSIANYSDYAIPEDSMDSPVAHAFAGAIVAERDYGITDTDILSAIYYHTTGRADMSLLEKVIFVADMLETGRDYDGVDRLRALVANDFELGFRACIKATYEQLKSKTNDIYPLTEMAYNYYIN